MLRQEKMKHTQVETVISWKGRRRSWILHLSAIVVLVTSLYAQEVSRPNVPDAINAPAAEEPILLLHALGSQIYICQPASDGQPTWVLKAPDAKLRNQQGTMVGRHYGGPTWKDNDGSEVTGKAVAKVDSPDPASIPWLLVIASGHSGQGVLTQVTSIQRINTRGGMPPPAAQCNTQASKAEVQSKYTADYYFYAPRQAALPK
jgi:hypothetical protein